MVSKTGEAADINDCFWRVRHDWVTYKVPVPEGKVIIPHDYLEPGYIIDPVEHWYRFIHNRQDRRKIGDFSAYGGGAFFVNERAYQIFKAIFLRHGRAFPVCCSNLPYYIVLIDRLHDAIDLNLSAFVRSLDDGGPIEDDISQVKKIILNKGFETTDDVFRIDRGFALKQEIIVSDKFKSLYEKAKLTGLIFSAATECE